MIYNSHLDFGKALKRLRKERDLSQEKLADLSGLDRSYISILERNLKLPSLYTILALATGLDIKPSEVMMEMEKSPVFDLDKSGPASDFCDPDCYKEPHFY
ncbi:helix-turn-helix domain-containing protein [Neobacillus niacini]|uniref:helix-turn-helix domain-containing protein n=1 Tax=Neobacillus niacini TaxID=86668 RepID=UPI00203C5803|nr:helix-turn-helix domain-containing protein [Neobacillus niacini]